MRIVAHFVLADGLCIRRLSPNMAKEAYSTGLFSVRSVQWVLRSGTLCALGAAGKVVTLSGGTKMLFCVLRYRQM